jgi:hypothetical protein
MFALSYASRIAAIYHSDIVEREYLRHLNNRELDLWEPLIAILYIIDHQDLTGLMQPLLSLSEQSFEEKSADNLIDNDTSRIIVGLKALLESDLDFKDVPENGIDFRAYKAVDVVAFLQQNVGVHLGQKELSGRLKALQIVVKQRREGQDRHMTYAFSAEQVNELMDRFNVTDV